MGKVVHLGRERKRRKQAADKRTADANAVAFGRTKSEKLAARRERARLESIVDGAKMATDNDVSTEDPT